MFTFANPDASKMLNSKWLSDHGFVFDDDAFTRVVLKDGVPYKKIYVKIDAYQSDRWNGGVYFINEDLEWEFEKEIVTYYPTAKSAVEGIVWNYFGWSDLDISKSEIKQSSNEITTDSKKKVVYRDANGRFVSKSNLNRSVGKGTNRLSKIHK